MGADYWVALATLALVGATAFAGVASLRGVRDQLWLITFSEYTRRYSEIMDGLPYEARRPGGDFDLKKLAEGERERVLATARRYLNLCSEELYLNKRGALDDGTWEIWRTGIADTARMPFFRDAWELLRQEYDYYGDFHAMVDDLLVKAPVGTPTKRIAQQQLSPAPKTTPGA